MTQLFPHFVRPAPQVQLPTLQNPPGPQAFPQAPQLLASKLVFTHAPLQLVHPGKHDAWQELNRHT